VDTWVRLRGKLTLQAWDPHTGTMTPLESEYLTAGGQAVTRVRLMLDPVQAVFLTSPFAANAGVEDGTNGTRK
jgi:hypothetical protein